MRITTLLTVISCAAALPAGWLTGRLGKAAFASDTDFFSQVTRTAPVEQTRPEVALTDTDAEAAAIAAMPGTERALAALEFSLRRGAGGLAALLNAARHDPTMIEFLVNVWRERDPYTLLQVMGDMDGLRLDSWTGMQFIELTEKLARRDIDGALKSANAINDPNMRRHTVGRMISAYFQEDTHRALELALAHPDLPIDSNINLDEVKPTPEMIPKLSTLPISITQPLLLTKALKTVPPDEAWRHTERLSGMMQWRVRREFSKEWAKKDLPAVMEQATKRDQPAVTRIVLHEAVIEEVMKTDVPAAAAWAEDNLSGSYRMRILKKAADALQKTDPAKAAELREKLPEAYKP